MLYIVSSIDENNNVRYTFLYLIIENVFILSGAGTLMQLEEYARGRNWEKHFHKYSKTGT